MKITTSMIVRMATIAALYFTINTLFAPISFGPLQFRVANLLLALALFSPDYGFGIGLGVFFANLASPFGAFDFVLMPIVSGIMAGMIWKIRWQFANGWWIGLLSYAVVTSLAVAYFPLWLGGRIPFALTFPYVLTSQVIVVFLSAAFWKKYAKFILVDRSEEPE